MASEASAQPAPRRAAPIQAIPPRSAKGALLPPRATANGTLRRLQEAALIGFAERGYHGLSTRELARATGVRVSSVYSHVNAKEDILLELMVLGHQEHNSVLRHALLGAEPEPARQLEALVVAHVMFHAGFPLLARVCNRELHALSPENIGGVMAIRLDSERLFLEVVERGITAKTFKCGDAWVAVAAIGGMGIRVADWFDAAGARRPEDVARAYAEFAIKMLS